MEFFIVAAMIAAFWFLFYFHYQAKHYIKRAESLELHAKNVEYLMNQKQIALDSAKTDNEVLQKAIKRLHMEDAVLHATIDKIRVLVDGTALEQLRKEQAYRNSNA